MLFNNTKESKFFKCVFCDSQHDDYSKCESARKLSREERKEVAKRAGRCYKCLNHGHIGKKCNVKNICPWCSQRHLLIMCPNMHRTDTQISNEHKQPNTKKECNERTFGNSEWNKSGVLTNMSERSAVYLQTLKVKVFSDSKEYTVRAIIDTASHRSYLRSDVAKQVGYEPCGKQKIIHTLFGGIKSTSTECAEYLVRVKNLENSYSCNFNALTHKIICNDVPCIKADKWEYKLREKGIFLSDIGTDAGAIDLLIGADVAGDLFTGAKIEIENRFNAFETRLGWVVMGTRTILDCIPKKNNSEDNRRMRSMQTTGIIVEVNTLDPTRSVLEVCEQERQILRTLRTTTLQPR